MAPADCGRGVADRKSGPIQERYQRLSVSREPFLDEARRCAQLTIPSLCPPSGLSNGAKLHEPYQMIGALGVKNLAEKLLMTMYPPGRPFFRLTVNQFDLEKMIARTAAAMVQGRRIDPEAGEEFITKMQRTITAEVEKNLAASERAIVRDFEIDNNRPTDSEAVKHLVNNGNVLRYCPQNKRENPRIYDLSHYVVKRDPDGTVLEMITREGLTALTADPEVAEACGLKPGDDGCDKEYDLFTRIKREREGEKEHWAVSQELNGVEVPDSAEEYPVDVCPWIPLRWTKLDGEDYGRGYVSDLRGSLRSLEALTRALVENCVAGARTLGFVNPNSQYGTRLRDVARAENGAILPGNAQDVTFLRVEKANDLSSGLQQAQTLTQMLSQAFLLNSSVRREAERVTATEISVLAQELNIALGGVYSTLGKEYQQPILANLMAKMKKDKSLPEIPEEVKITIITGVDALGRNADLEKLVQYGQFVSQFPPQVVMEYLQFSDMLRQGAVALGINADLILKSEEEVASQRQQQMQLALAQQAIGPAIQAAANGDPAAAGAPEAMQAAQQPMP